MSWRDKKIRHLLQTGRPRRPAVRVQICSCSNGERQTGQRCGIRPSNDNLDTPQCTSYIKVSLMNTHIDQPSAIYPVEAHECSCWQGPDNFTVSAGEFASVKDAAVRHQNLAYHMRASCRHVTSQVQGRLGGHVRRWPRAPASIRTAWRPKRKSLVLCRPRLRFGCPETQLFGLLLRSKLDGALASLEGESSLRKLFLILFSSF